MGIHTGKALDFATCNKRCQLCETSVRLGKEPKPRDCRRNYNASAKSMEAHVATVLFKRAAEKGVCYQTLIGDDDSSTISKLREEVDDQIIKVSDIQHIKRTLEGKLLKIKSQHKELTDTVIKYIKKCFSYAIAQNKGDPTSLATALQSIPGHIFGDHSRCNKAWCGYHKDPEHYLHKSLSRTGKDLTSVALHDALVNILSTFAANAEKLAPHGSSQRNEALNNTIGSKAPKIRHYGGSSSNDQRIAAAVAQKNIGYTFVPKVMTHLNVSPGTYTSAHALRMNRKIQLNKQKSKSPSRKHWRLVRRATRSIEQKEREIREGVQYQTGVGLNTDPLDITQIPDPIFRPSLEHLQECSKQQIVIFDLEQVRQIYSVYHMDLQV